MSDEGLHKIHTLCTTCFPGEYDLSSRRSRKILTYNQIKKTSVYFSFCISSFACWVETSISNEKVVWSGKTRRLRNNNCLLIVMYDDAFWNLTSTKTVNKTSVSIKMDFYFGVLEKGHNKWPFHTPDLISFYHLKNWVGTVKAGCWNVSAMSQYLTKRYFVN